MALITWWPESEYTIRARPPFPKFCLTSFFFIARAPLNPSRVVQLVATGMATERSATTRLDGLTLNPSPLGTLIASAAVLPPSTAPCSNSLSAPATPAAAAAARLPPPPPSSSSPSSSAAAASCSGAGDQWRRAEQRQRAGQITHGGSGRLPLRGADDLPDLGGPVLAYSCSRDSP